MRHLEYHKTPGGWAGFGQITEEDPSGTWFLDQWLTKEESLEGIKEYIESGFYDLVWIEDPMGKIFKTFRPSPADLERGKAAVFHYLISGDNQRGREIGFESSPMGILLLPTSPLRILPQVSSSTSFAFKVFLYEGREIDSIFKSSWARRA